MLDNPKYVFSDDPEDPKWEGASRVHDWRNHVSEAVRAIWHTFTPEQRRVLKDDADDRALDERWE